MIIFIIILFLNKSVFLITIIIYISLAFSFLFIRFSSWGISELFPKRYEKNKNSYSVILPVKDEPKNNLINCLKSIIKQKGEKEILVGDDGSKIPVSEILKDNKEILNKIILIRIDKNQGKKEMQLRLLKLLNKKYKVCVQMDSDVILKDSDTLLKLTAPFGNNKIGIANGQSFIISNGSLVHRLQDFMSLCAYEIGRNSMGRFGINPCCSGELMAFRKDVFENFIDEYRNTKYFGKLMNFGEDRFMTNIFLREGYKSIMVKGVIAYTYPKDKLKDLLKQQLRWKKSGIRESIRCAKTCSKRNKYLGFWSILNFSLPLLFIMIMLTMFIHDIILFRFIHLLLFFGVIITISTISDLPLLIKYPRLIPMVIPFIFYNLFLITPLWAIALFKLNDTGWGTR
jgi:cellulose synthase/poly-beta-1,6-N-acetylglucosamine synthase-like glycosyltransferase